MEREWEAISRRKEERYVVKRRRFRFRERFGVRTRFANHRTGGTASLYEAWLEAGSSPSTTGASFRIGHDPALDYRSASKGSLGWCYSVRETPFPRGKRDY